MQNKANNLAEVEHLISEEEVNITSKNMAQQFSVYKCLTLILRITILPVVAFIVFKTTQNFTFFSMHPVLMTMAYLICMLEAILLFSSWPLVVINKLTDRVTLHGLLQGSCLVMSSIGFGVVAYNKILLNKNHFASWHSWFGLLAFIMNIGNALGGVMAKYPSLNKAVKPLVMKTMHAGCACLTFGLVVASLLSGLNSNYFRRLNDNNYFPWQIVFLVPIIAYISVINQVVRSYYPRFRVA